MQHLLLFHIPHPPTWRMALVEPLAADATACGGIAVPVPGTWQRGVALVPAGKQKRQCRDVNKRQQREGHISRREQTRSGRQAAKTWRQVTIGDMNCMIYDNIWRMDWRIWNNSSKTKQSGKRRYV